MRKIELTIYGNPRVKKNNQKVYKTRTGRPFKVDTPAYKSWRNEAETQLILDDKQKPKRPIDYPINLQCRFYMQTRGSVDLSALYEGIQDVLVKQGWLADDNYKVVASHDGSGVEYDKESPRMEITITKK